MVTLHTVFSTVRSITISLGPREQNSGSLLPCRYCGAGKAPVEPHWPLALPCGTANGPVSMKQR